MNDRRYNGVAPLDQAGIKQDQDQKQEHSDITNVISSPPSKTLSPLVTDDQLDYQAIEDFKRPIIDRLQWARERGLVPDYSRMYQSEGHTFVPLQPDIRPTHRCRDCRRTFTLKYGTHSCECGHCGGTLDLLAAKALVMGRDRMELADIPLRWDEGIDVIRNREVYRWQPALGGWVYKGVRRG